MNETPKEESLTFEKWIDEYGIKKLAKKLNVGDFTVDAWRRGRCDPRTDYIRQIKLISKGRVTYDMIIDRLVLSSRVGVIRKRKIN